MLKTSGVGVTTAATIAMSRIAYLRFRVKKAARPPEITQQGKDERKFEGEPESEDEKGAEGDIFSHGDHGLDMGGLISQQELDAEREGDEVTKEAPR